jgi:O-antigen/teichoic acid export membrane protein
VALVLQTAVATLLTLVQVKLLSDFLSREVFGLFASLRGFSLLLSMLAANGLPQLLVRFIPAHESMHARARALRLSVGCLIGAALALVVLGAIAHLLRQWTFAFVDPSLLTGDLVFWFYATTLGVTAKLILYGGFNGTRRLATQVVLEVLSLAAILVWIAAAGHGLSLALLFRILGVVNLATVAVGTPIYFFLLVRSTTGASSREGRAAANGKSTGGIGYGSYLTWAAGLSVVALAFTDVDRYLLAQVLTLEVLALFHIGARIGRLANRLLGVSNLAFQPEVTRLDSEGRGPGIEHQTRIFLKFNSMLAVAMTCFIALFAIELIVLIASDEYVGAAPLLYLLVAGLPLTTMTAPVTSVMKARDQVRGALFTDLVWMVMYVGLMMVLGARYGLIGVGVANLCACAAQLVAALAISKLSIGYGSVVTIMVKLATAAVISYWPAAVVGALAIGGSGATHLGLKALLFLLGCFLFQKVLRSLKILSSEERTALKNILETKNAGFLARFV